MATTSKAIKTFKYELCGIDEKTDKRNYAIECQTRGKEDLLERLKALEPLKYPQDDIGLSRLFSALFKDFFRYNKTAKEWYIYTGKVWVEDKGAMVVKHLAKDFAKALLTFGISIEDDDKQKMFINFANRLNKLGARET